MKVYVTKAQRHGQRATFAAVKERERGKLL